jgi:hypothetical protein
MEDEPTNFPEYSQEDLDKAHNEALEAANGLHKKFTALAEGAGYIVITLGDTKSRLDGLLDAAKSDPSAYPFVASGIDYLRGLTNELNYLNATTDDARDRLGGTVNSTGTFASSTDTGAQFYDLQYEPPARKAPPSPKTREDYSTKLRGLDPALGDLYDQVWQSHLATLADPQRAALFMMRTLFDNFFAWLAPDDQVRASVHWRKKEGDKPDQIWRSERLAFALENKINDKNRRDLLEAEANQISALYKAANEAHNRGKLDDDKASNTLVAMDRLLKDWIDSLN